MKSPVETVPPVGTHYFVDTNTWAIKQLDGNHVPVAWWQDVISTTANTIITGACQASAAVPTESESISLLWGSGAAPSSLFTMVGAWDNHTNLCDQTSEGDYSCDTTPPPPATGSYQCLGPWAGTQYGDYPAPSLTDQSIAFNSYSFGCQTKIWNPNLPGYENWKHQCTERQSTPNGDAWNPDATKVFTTVSAGTTTDFSVN